MLFLQIQANNKINLVNLVLSNLADIFVCYSVKYMQEIRCPLEMIGNTLVTNL